VSREKEEVLTEPSNHAILKFLAGEEEKHLQEAAEEVGMEEDRIRKKSEILEQKGFLQRDFSPEGVKIRIVRGKLEETRSELGEFLEEHSSRMSVKATEEKKALQELREELKEQKEETDVVKKEKKIEGRIEAVEKAMEKIENSGDDSREKFDAFSHSHRIQRFLGSRDEEFHSFNPGRKLKAIDRVEEVLDQQPEKDEPRRFFGNRWVVEK
jgi:DNA-binding MarR family transcriptional regulator